VILALDRPRDDEDQEGASPAQGKGDEANVVIVALVPLPSFPIGYIKTLASFCADHIQNRENVSQGGALLACRNCRIFV
jgi:hypothetical protein